MKTATVLFDTSDAVDPSQQGPTRAAESAAASWSAYKEDVGHGARSVTSPTLLEQLALTENDWDYLWYKTAAPTG
eukprot:gene49630-51692_t